MIAVFLLYFLFVIVRFVVSLYFDEPYIMGDELVYKTMALSFFQTGKFSSPQFAHVGVPIDFPNVMYQMVISWVFILKHNFYTAIKLTNALISNLAIFPLYYLGRIYMTHERSLMAAALVLLLPEMTYANNVMPENLYFPLFFAAVYFILRTEDHGSKMTSCFAGLFLGLLYLTKPHGVAVIFSEVLWASLLVISKVRGQKNVAPFVGRIILLNFVALCIILAGKYFKGGLEWGVYSHILRRTNAVDIVPLMQYVIALLTSIFFVFGAPLIIMMKSLSSSGDTDRDKLSHYSLLALLLLVSMVGMTILYTIKIAPQENFQRLHERYFYFALGLILVGAAAGIDKFRLQRYQLGMAAGAVIANIALWLTFFYHPIVLPHGLNFNHDYLGYSWVAVLPKMLSYVAMCAVVALNIFMLFNQRHFKAIAVLWVGFFVLANVVLFLGLNQVQYRVASDIRKHRVFLEGRVPDEKSRVMLIDSSDIRKTNIPFWLNYTYSGSVIKPAGTAIQKSQIPAGTEYLVLLDNYPLEFDPVKTERDGLVSIHHMVREDMRRLLTGVYRDYWTKKVFAFDSPAKFQTMRIMLSDWQPSYPNRLEIRADQNTMTYLLDGSRNTLELPYARQYSFILERTWNPKSAGLNSDNRDLGVGIKRIELIP